MFKNKIGLCLTLQCSVEKPSSPPIRGGRLGPTWLFNFPAKIRPKPTSRRTIYWVQVSKSSLDCHAFLLLLLGYVKSCFLCFFGASFAFGIRTKNCSKQLCMIFLTKTNLVKGRWSEQLWHKKIIENHTINLATKQFFTSTFIHF